ncbi:MAG: hypothetical protein RXR20_26600 [Paraburkholderia sp.]|uniref:hypothetical protein n=1 Tax=Burkholderiaceae TaxID=119060 RepID=UPI0010F66325|nr:hypothetical protein [Burkholderia sp. 4M9327F10]
MKLTFIIPGAFTVYGVPQSERRRCYIRCEVVELVRWHSMETRVTLRGLRPARTSYTAYVRLPGWITPPDSWPRLETGEVELTVPMRFNRRIPFPQFPVGVDRVRPYAGETIRSEAC